LQRNVKLPAETVFPIYLPRASPLTALILKDLHETLHHAGPQTLIATYRLRYWTPQLRKLIRQVLFFDKKLKCLECFRFLAKAFKPPPEPALPPERMDESAPFVNVVVDFFGPFRVIMGNEEQKMYGVIFCCLSVHLEVCTDATGDRFHIWKCVRTQQATVFFLRFEGLLGVEAFRKRCCRTTLDNLNCRALC
jgi:hypothetical protein